METVTRPALSARAAGAPASPKRSLMASTIRADVVKSERRNCRRTAPRGATEGAARSTIAPSGVRPTVGWLTLWEVPPRPEAKPPVTTGPCHGVYLAIGAAQR